MIKIKYIFLLALTGIYVQELLAQAKNGLEIIGEVKDSISQEPLPYAHVRIKGRSIGVISNSEGKFLLMVPRQALDDSITISYIGYLSKNVSVKSIFSMGSQVFLLRENTTQLEESVVVAPDAEKIIQEVAKNLKATFPDAPFEFEGYYRNSYSQLKTHVKQFEAAFTGLDKNFHNRNGYSVFILKKRASPDYRKYKWKQSQGNVPWHYLWHIRRQHHYFFMHKEYRKYDCSVEDVVYFEGEKVYKLRFVLKDTSKRISESWAFIRARDYAILEIGGKTKVVNPTRFKLSDSLSMAYTGGNVVVKYIEHHGKMYPSYGRSLFEHDAYNESSRRLGSFDKNEEMIIHEIITPTNNHKETFFQTQQERILTLPIDSLFWNQYNKPVETALSRAVNKDLAAQQKKSGNSSSENLPVVYVDEPIAVEQLRRDFTLFRSSLEEAHPSLYRYTPKKDLDSLFESAYQCLTKPLLEIEFYRLLTPILAKIRCGHSGGLPSINYTNSSMKRAYFLPIQIKYIDNRLYVVKAYGSSLKETEGNEIVSINGLPIEDLVNRIYPHIPADGFITSSKQQALSWNFAKLYSLYIGQSASFNIVSRNRQGALKTFRTIAISPEAYMAWRGNINIENEYELLDSNTAILKIDSFKNTDSRQFKIWVEEVFLDMFEKRIAHLIIDLRNNEGGRDDYALYLLTFLAKAPFYYHLSLHAATSHYSFLSFSDQDESLNSLMSEIVKKDSLGKFILRNSHPTLKLNYPQTKPFTGKVYFLINGNTFSAAADFAALANELKLGEFIGEETGGAFEGNTSNGEILLTLPNSGIRIIIPLFQIKNAVSETEAKGRGVIPGHKTHYSIDDFIYHTDKELELVENLISKKWEE